MNLLLFLIILATSFVVVRIGAVAFELTGLEWSLAKFQALSCFSGTGFTTKESELIVGNPQRRRIASILIMLGNAGLVTMIATLANSLRADALMPRFKVPFVDLVFPARLIPWVNLLIIIVAIYTAYKVFTRSVLAKKLTDFLRIHIIKREIITPVSFEELTLFTGGYGVSSIEVDQDSPVLDKTLLESNLRKLDINILAIEREDRIIANPSPDTKIMSGDRLICFGRSEAIRKGLSLNK
ncbi:MAG: hypothetical protein GF375_05940 [Candidatus Omnitrophica bacterium]|nr:hypothetical protein [Candidatus Omnitrophota bacterium]MBD3269516.1 hypothetical protein [Candidatus Omnitrophota bacterium]